MIDHSTARFRPGRAALELAHQRILDAEDDIRIQIFVAVDEDMRDQRLVAGRCDHEMDVRGAVGMTPLRSQHVAARQACQSDARCIEQRE